MTTVEHDHCGTLCSFVQNSRVVYGTASNAGNGSPDFRRKTSAKLLQGQDELPRARCLCVQTHGDGGVMGKGEGGVESTNHSARWFRGRSSGSRGLRQCLTSGRLRARDHDLSGSHLSPRGSRQCQRWALVRVNWSHLHEALSTAAGSWEAFNNHRL